MDRGAETQVARRVWDAHTDEVYRQDQSHWRGVGRWADDAAWQAIGRSSRQKIDQLARFLGRETPNDAVMLEWGPGGGANVFAFRQITRSYYGIDISEKNLAEAQRMIRAEADATTVFEPVLLHDDPNEALAQASGVQVFLSTACFQHFPSKEYGAQVLKVIRQACARSAIGMIQIRYDNGNPRFMPIQALEQYESRHITANSYALDEFNDLCVEAGFKVHFIADVASKNNYASFYMSVR